MPAALFVKIFLNLLVFTISTVSCSGFVVNTCFVAKYGTIETFFAKLKELQFFYRKDFFIITLNVLTRKS
jgi:hypothetical protein